MKIIGLEAFKLLPSGTAYAKYIPSVVGPLEFKGEFSDDSCYSYKLAAGYLKAYEPVPKNINLADFHECRATSNQLFMIYDNADINSIINKLCDAQVFGDLKQNVVENECGSIPKIISTEIHAGKKITKTIPSRIRGNLAHWIVNDNSFRGTANINPLKSNTDAAETDRISKITAAMCK